MRADGVVRDLARRVPEPGEVGHDHTVGSGELWGERIKIAFASRATVKQNQDRGVIASVGTVLSISDAHDLRGPTLGINCMRRSLIDFTIPLLTEDIRTANHG